MARNVQVPRVADAIETPRAGEWAKIKRDVDRGYRIFCEKRGINPEDFSFGAQQQSIFARKRRGRPTKAEQEDRENAKADEEQGTEGAPPE